MGISLRERRLGAAFYLFTAISTIVWIVSLVFVPRTKDLTLGSAINERLVWVFILPDVISALVLATWLAPAVLKASQSVPAISWMHVGAQGYGWAMSIGLTVLDPNAYWGLVLMTFSVGSALAFALRFQEIDMLWGYFKFTPAPDRDSTANWHRALLQTLLMWIIFLGILPGAIAFGEYHLGFSRNWIVGDWRLSLGVLMFTVGTVIGLCSGYAMTREGNGTPLPSECTRNLIISGPYRFIRNPMAFSGIIQGVAVGLMIGSSLVSVYSVLGGIWWEVLVRWREEQHLEESFGEEYVAYRNRVPCWWFRA